LNNKAPPRATGRARAWLPALLALPLAAALAGCAAPGAAPGSGRSERTGAAMQAEPGRHIVLAVDNLLAPAGGRAGGSLGGYGPAPRYLQGQRAAGTLAALAREHGLREVAGWPIVALGWQCVVFELPPADTATATAADGGVGAAARRRDTLLATLAADPRVRLVQPLQEFETLAAPAAATPAFETAGALAYNDPYVHLQRGFADLAAAQAHLVSVGAGVRVAVVDTGAAIGHPDLQGRIGLVRDFVDGRPDSGSGFDADRHGTQVAGIIAAAGNNHHGIVGIAPQARLDLHKACWQRDGAPGAAARCNSFTLAQALAAVLASDARIVNLSLGGPADPLLDRLLAELLKQGRIVVGALPPGGRRGGFPTGTPGVIAAASAGQAAGADIVLAPGQDVLTLQPGGAYDYASGSSLAAAHVSGVAALLLAADPRLTADRLRTLLAPSGTAPLNASTALQALQLQGAVTARR
jgi:hypothetical protein